MKVLMVPHADRIGNGASGIAQVVRAYFRHLPEFGIELVGQDATSYDLKAVHAGNAIGDVCHCHGLYWNADHDAPMWEYRANADVVEAIRHAREVTVPSAWVAETFQRDMHFMPYVVPHGIDWKAWQHDQESGGYVLWNKNRTGDVCDVRPLEYLARRFPGQKFVSTFPPDDERPSNLLATGLLKHGDMKRLIQAAGVYLATTKETFGIGILEAMAAGIPVLGYAHGGVVDLVQHGVNGYLATPGNLDDLTDGLVYCLKHGATLGANGRELARYWTWEAACEQVAKLYEDALAEEQPTVAVVIPSFNHGEKVGRAVESVVAQTYAQLTDIVVVDDGSDDGGLTRATVEGLAEKDDRVRYVRQDNAGVAVARNTGISLTDTKYVSCLDADDAMAPTFLGKVIPALETDRSVGIAASGMKLIAPRSESENAHEPNFDDFLEGKCQVPTCCVFRREAWERLGGYRQRYAPHGAGAEDAELWLRMGAAGWGMKLATPEPLFLYSWGEGTTTTRGKDYQEVDWLYWHPWTADGEHPFASIATPPRYSHPVRQYDEPVISVVIPVGPGHEEHVIDALDSLEAQTFRKWEAVVVWDGPTISDWMLKAYPFAKFTATSDYETGKEKAKGAGFARNRGVEIARAPIVYFLDADDWLYPYALEDLFAEFVEQGGDVGAYGDYDSLEILSPEMVEEARKANRLVQEGDPVSVVRYHGLDYDQGKINNQPNLDDPYYWCNVSVLLPKAWHFEIGGFDEGMDSWEDWDYYLRLARAGKCFMRVEEPVMVYRHYAGFRRDWARQNAEMLVQYMREKYAGSDITMCKNCGGSSARSSMLRDRPARSSAPRSLREISAPQDPDLVKVEYISANRGSEGVYGTHVFPQRVVGDLGNAMRGTRGGFVFFYGYRTPGDQFYVHQLDVDEAPHKFRPVAVPQSLIPGIPMARAVEPPPPISLEEIIPEIPKEPVSVGAESALEGTEVVAQAAEVVEVEFDPQTIPGITASIAQQMKEAGLVTRDQVVALGIEGLKGFRGVGRKKAETIMAAVAAQPAAPVLDVEAELARLLAE